MKDEYKINNNGDFDYLVKRLKKSGLEITESTKNYIIFDDATFINNGKRSEFHMDISVTGNQERLSMVEKILNTRGVVKK